MKLTPKQFAVALKCHRERLNLTQAEAAILCEVSPRSWWKWEHAIADTLAVTQEGALARLKSASVKK